jgi:hypothetical protein
MLLIFIIIEMCSKSVKFLCANVVVVEGEDFGWFAEEVQLICSLQIEIKKKGGKKKVKMRKTLLLGLVAVVAVGLLSVEFIQMSGIKEVSAKQWTGLSYAYCVAIGDYNNDGLNDLAFTESGSNKVTVYASDGTTVIKQWTGLSGPVGVAIGDYDNDGLSDIAITTSTGQYSPGNVTVYKNDGTTVIKQWTGINEPAGVAIGDYDNDGLNDIAFVAASGRTVTVYKSDGTTIIKQWTGLLWPPDVAIGDYNNDGLNEIAIAENGRSGGGDKVTVYKSDGVTVIKQWTGVYNTWGVAIGDYDNDRLNDIAFTDSTQRIWVYESDGTTLIKQLTLTANAQGLAIGDYNNDGLNDLAFVEGVAGRVTVYYQTKQGIVTRVAEPTIITLRGTLTNATGYPIQSGSIRVKIKDSLGRQVWQDTFDNVIDNGRYNIPLGTKTTLMPIKGQVYSAILEVDADSPTFVSADVIYGDNNPAGDIIKFVA